MKQHRLFALLTAAVMVLSLAGCGGSGAPESSAGAAPEPENAGADPVIEPLDAWELAVDGELFAQYCADVAHGKAIFLDGYDSYPGRDECGSNLFEVDLYTGEKKRLDIWADQGLVRWDGHHYYYVAMTDQPVHLTADGPMGHAEWDQHLQAGIWKGDGSGAGELIYTLPDRAVPLTRPISPGTTDRPEITRLSLGEGFLSWSEVWMEQDGNYGYRLYTMDLGTEEVQERLEIGPIQRGVNEDLFRSGFQMDGSRLTFWNPLSDSLYLYDPAGSRELSNPPELSDTVDLCADGNRVVWAQQHWIGGPARPSFSVYTPATGESYTVDIPGEDGSSAAVGGVSLFGGRYLLYSRYDGRSAHKGVELYDLEAGEVIYRSAEDSRLPSGGLIARQGRLLAEGNNRGLAIVIGPNERQTVVTVFRAIVAGVPAAPPPSDADGSGADDGSEADRIMAGILASYYYAPEEPVEVRDPEGLIPAGRRVDTSRLIEVYTTEPVDGPEALLAFARRLGRGEKLEGMLKPAGEFYTVITDESGRAAGDVFLAAEGMEAVSYGYIYPGMEEAIRQDFRFPEAVAELVRLGALRGESTRLTHCIISGIAVGVLVSDGTEEYFVQTTESMTPRNLLTVGDIRPVPELGAIIEEHLGEFWPESEVDEMGNPYTA